MPIDTSIYGQLQPMRLESPLNALAQVMQVKQGQQQNKLAELALGQKQREVADDQAVRDWYKANGTNAESLDGLAGISPTAYRAETKSRAEVAKSQREAEKAQYEATGQRLELVGRIFGPVLENPALYPQALAYARQQIPGGGKDLPEQYDEAAVKGMLGRALTLKEQNEQQWKQKDYNLNVDKFGYQKQNDAENRNVTLRGQNMTDARGREANALKLDENNIKRTEKKATEDLTKNSQVASFDTMLGTLDRLGTHKGLSRSVGVMGALPTRPGSESANFQAELNTFQSQAFIPMVSQLKGMGALSDAEGKKLTAAVGALDPSMGEEAFRSSIKRIKADMEAARQRVAGKPRETANVPATVTNAADYAKVPSGAEYVDPKGVTRRKP